MSIRIHHATAKKAAKAGLTMKVVENEVEVYNGEAMLASAPAANTALDQAIAKLGDSGKGDKPVRKATKKAAPAKAKAPAATGSVISKAYRVQYEDGSNGDDVAKRFKKFLDDGGSVRALAEANNAWNPAWARLNPGMQRMNCGNVLRARAKKGVKISWNV